MNRSTTSTVKMSLLLPLLSFLLLLPWPSSAAPPLRHARAAAAGGSFSNGGGGSVKLYSRLKMHGEGEKCPTLSYCSCKSKRTGLDVTCDRVNSYKLRVSGEYCLSFFNIKVKNACSDCSQPCLRRKSY